MSATVSTLLLGRETFSFARRNLVSAANTSPEDRILPRAEDVRGRFTNVDGTTTSLEIATRDPREAIRVTVARRGYPAGDVTAARTTDPIRVYAPEQLVSIDVTVPRNAHEPGPWFYEASFHRQPTGGSPEEANSGVREFLCESAPFRWRGRSDRIVQPVTRLVDPPADVRSGKYRRTIHENDHLVSFEWRDASARSWHVDYRLRRSLHEAAVERERGYARTFTESQSSPVAAELAATIRQRARIAAIPTRSKREGSTIGGRGLPISVAVEDENENENEDDIDGTNGADSADSAGGDTVTFADLPPGEQFEGFVRFVQDIEYARDFHTTDSYEYNRTVEETIVDGVGDCKDKTYLLAGLLGAPPLECDTALLVQPAHVLLGVRIEDVPEPFDAIDPVSLGGREYLPIEPSWRFDLGYYPRNPFTAAFANGQWIHFDVTAARRGLDRYVEDVLESRSGKSA